MKWSFSGHRSFGKCPRQWFFKTIFANSRANDPARREAHRLSKLENILAWRGKVVDAVISDVIIPALARGQFVSAADAQRTALSWFDAQRARRTSNHGGNAHAPTDESSFYEIEYNQPLTDEAFAAARSDVQLSIENLYRAEPIWALLRGARGLFPQRTLTFRQGDASVQVRPDVIAFRPQAAPVIVDWKVNARPLRDYWLQLVTGAIAVTRCAPHRDWPIGAVGHPPHEVELLEVQLLTEDVRAHRISAEDVDDAEDFITVSAGRMQLACGDERPNKLRPEDFAVARDPWACQTCPFRKPCWGSAS